MIIEVERRVHELKCWDIGVLQMCVQATPLEVDSRSMHFFNRGEVFIKQSRENNCEQYKIKGIAQAETIRHKWDL